MEVSKDFDVEAKERGIQNGRRMAIVKPRFKVFDLFLILRKRM
jgi:hypothetical protein